MDSKSIWKTICQGLLGNQPKTKRSKKSPDVHDGQKPREDHEAKSIKATNMSAASGKTSMHKDADAQER